MRPIRNFPHLFGTILFLSLSQIALSQAKPSTTHNLSSSGRSTFNSTCAGCHGLDGHGSDKAVNIATNARAQGFSDARLASIISNGVPGTGMPAFHTLTPTQVRALVAYLRTLQGKGEASSLPGDAKRGKEIFFGKGDCSSCHTISGEGGFMGPDLTNYGATASADGIRSEIVKAPRLPSRGYRMALITTANGDRLEGLIRNEDNFSIQLQTKDGNFHLLRKAEMQSCQNLDGSLMPADYRKKLTDSELNDLASYLLTTPQPSEAAHHPEKDDFE